MSPIKKGVISVSIGVPSYYKIAIWVLQDTTEVSYKLDILTKPQIIKKSIYDLKVKKKKTLFIFIQLCYFFFFFIIVYDYSDNMMYVTIVKPELRPPKPV